MWLSPGAGRAPTAAERVELRQRTVDTLMSQLMTGQAVIGLNACLVVLAVAVAGVPAPWAVIVWALLELVAVAHVVLFRATAGGRRRPDHRSSIRWAALSTVVTVALYAVLVLPLHPAEGDLRVFLVANAMAAAAVGAAFLASSALVSSLWVAGFTVVLAVGATIRGNGLSLILAVQAVVFGLLLVAGSRFMGSLLQQRALREIRAAAAEQVASTLLADFEGSASDWLWETDDDGRFVRTSSRFAAVTGIPEAELQQRGWADLLAPDSALPFTDDRFLRHTVGIVLDSGVRFWDVSGYRLPGGATGWRGVAGDVTDRERHSRDMELLARTDRLTGLPNRYGFEQVVAALGEPVPATVRFGILDLDNFKLLNDSLGHEVGDRALRTLAGRLADCAESFGLVICRLGGDEFAIVAIDRPEGTESLTRVLLGAVRAAIPIGEYSLTIQGSLGWATADRDGRSATDLLKAADLAMYAVKENGGDGGGEYRAELGVQARSRHTLLSDLERALPEGQFVVEYQPIFAADTLTLRGHEALLRWNHPVRGLLYPDRFIEELEGGRLIRPVGLWVLDQALAQAARWPDGLTIAVNVAESQLADRDFVEGVRLLLRRHDIGAHRLTVEIVERAVVGSGQAVPRHLAELRSWGVRIALDDFGTQYSTIRNLDRLGIDVVKIDRAFVAPLNRDEESPLAELIIEVAHRVGATVVAEGIESAAAVARLQRLGCDELQGFHLGRPGPPRSVVPGQRGAPTEPGELRRPT